MTRDETTLTGDGALSMRAFREIDRSHGDAGGLDVGCPSCLARAFHVHVDIGSSTLSIRCVTCGKGGLAVHVAQEPPPKNRLTESSDT